MSDNHVSRRQALGRVGAIAAGTMAGGTFDRGQTMAAPRLAPRDQLVNVLEYEEQARSARRRRPTR